MGRAIFARRLSRQFFENAIELRQRLKSDCKCDFAYSKIDTFQKLARFLEPQARDIIDELYARHLFELLAQVSRIDPNRFCHIAQRKLFGRMFLDELARLPDIARLRPVFVRRKAIPPSEASFGEVC